jgi:7-cyano-7-deazaguanine reductase
MTLNYQNIDASILRALRNPVKAAYEIKIKIPECTFLGVPDQPDFADVYLTFHPERSIIELKSLKLYFQQFRNVVVSYERLINVIYNDIIKTYEPRRLRVAMICNPRGGISSRLTVDSDWKERGGRDEFQHWLQDDVWSVTV